MGSSDLGQTARQICNAAGILREVKGPHEVAKTILMLIQKVTTGERLMLLAIAQGQHPLLPNNRDERSKDVHRPCVHRHTPTVVLLHAGQVDQKMHEMMIAAGSRALSEVHREIRSVKVYLCAWKEPREAGAKRADEFHHIISHCIGYLDWFE